METVPTTRRSSPATRTCARADVEDALVAARLDEAADALAQLGSSRVLTRRDEAGCTRKPVHARSRLRQGRSLRSLLSSVEPTLMPAPGSGKAGASALC
jgi:hypothetical protein